MLGLTFGEYLENVPWKWVRKSATCGEHSEIAAWRVIHCKTFRKSFLNILVIVFAGCFLCKLYHHVKTAILSAALFDMKGFLLKLLTGCPWCTSAILMLKFMAQREWRGVFFFFWLIFWISKRWIYFGESCRNLEMRVWNDITSGSVDIHHCLIDDCAQDASEEKLLDS